MKVENNIDRYFKKNLEDFQVTPPEGVWDTIEQDLKKNSRKIIVPFYLKVAAGILLLTSLASILWKVLENTEPVSTNVLSEEIVPTESIQDTGTIEIVIKEESENQLTKAENTAPPPYSYNKPSIVQAPSLTKESVPVLPVVDQETQEDMENSSMPVEPMIEAVIAEKTSEPIPEIPDTTQYEPKKEVNRNDVIIQQNLMALEENTKESTPSSGSRWSIGGQAGPQYSYRDVSVSPDNQNTQNYDQFEDGMLAFAGGVNVQMKAAKRFSIQSGVYYSKIGQEVSSMVYGTDNFNYDVVADGTNANPSIGTLDISKNYRQASADAPVENIVSEGTYSTEQYFEFVEIPVVFKYFVIDRKLNVSLNGGLWTQILVGNTAITTGNDFYAKEETNDINTMNYSGSLGIGFNYPITSNLLISLDPIFKYYLSPINSNPETEVHPYTFGIMTGINFNF